MSEVNSIQPAAYPQAFRGEKQSSSSPIVPSLIVGGAAAGATAMWGGKKMDVDTFYSSLKDKKEIAFSKELEGDAKAKFEAAKTAAEADAPATTTAAGATPAKVELTPLQKAEAAFNESNVNSQRAEENLQSAQNRTNKIQNIYDDIAEFDPTAKPLDAGETKKKLQAQKTTLNTSITNDRAALADETLSKKVKEKIEARIKANEETIKGIDEKIAKPEAITESHIKELAEKAKKEAEIAERAVKDSKRALETAEIEHSRAVEDLNTAKSAAKPDEAKVKELEAKVKAQKANVDAATHTNGIKRAESEFASSLQTALETPDAAARKTALKKLHAERTAIVDVEGKAGSLVKEVEGLEATRVKSFETLYGHQTNAPVEAAKEAAYRKAIGKSTAEAVTDAGKTAAKEGAEAAKKEIPTVIKEGFEAVKDNLKKVKPGALKIAGFGAGAAVLTYIIAKMAGGKRPEQA